MIPEWIGCLCFVGGPVLVGVVGWLLGEGHIRIIGNNKEEQQE